MSMLHINQLFIWLSDTIFPPLWSGRMLPVSHYLKSLLKFQSWPIEVSNEKIEH